AAAVRRRAGRRRGPGAAGDRPRHPGGLRAVDLALHHAGHPIAAALRDATDRLLIWLTLGVRGSGPATPALPRVRLGAARDARDGRASLAVRRLWSGRRPRSGPGSLAADAGRAARGRPARALEERAQQPASRPDAAVDAALGLRSIARRSAGVRGAAVGAGLEQRVPARRRPAARRLAVRLTRRALGSVGVRGLPRSGSAGPDRRGRERVRLALDLPRGAGRAAPRERADAGRAQRAPRRPAAPAASPGVSQSSSLSGSGSTLSTSTNALPSNGRYS